MDATFAAWALVMLAGFCGSALYSGLETGAYMANRVRLQILAHQGRHSALVLRRLLQHRTVLLTTLLIGNNVTNYMGTAGLAVLLERGGFGETQAIILNAAVVTPILFVFGETLPKDLFAAHCDRLMYPFARFLDLSRQLFKLTGILPLISRTSDALLRRMHSGQELGVLHPRRQISALVKEGVGRGILSDDQSAMVERVLALGGRRVGDEMTRWREVLKVRVDDDPGVLWDLVDQSSRSRFPVVDARGAVVGMVGAIEAMMLGRDRCPPIRELMQRAHTVEAGAPLREALAQLQSQRLALAVVVEGGRPVGVVTIKDLVEPITGELIAW